MVFNSIIIIAICLFTASIKMFSVHALATAKGQVMTNDLRSLELFFIVKRCRGKLNFESFGFSWIIIRKQSSSGSLSNFYTFRHRHKSTE